jgi:FHS family L-fucose permease-like MFS transporter
MVSKQPNAKIIATKNSTSQTHCALCLSAQAVLANPFIATCGTPRLSEFRLELSQSFQAISSIMAPLLAPRLFFSHTEPYDLSKVQWTYLGIAAFVFCLAVVFFFTPIPEVTDADMALQAEQCSGLTGYVDKPMERQYKLMFGVAAQFCYVGAQVCLLQFSQFHAIAKFIHVGVAANFINYARKSAGISAAAASDCYAIGQGPLAIGPFTAAGLMMSVKPRIFLMVFMTAIGVKGEGGVAMLSLVLFFFESCIFPTTLKLSIRGLGRHTKGGSSWIVASVSGGALFPSLTGLLADRRDYHS